MRRSEAALRGWRFALLLCFALGCSSVSPPARMPLAPQPPVRPGTTDSPANTNSIQQAAYQEAEPARPSADMLPAPRSLSAPNADQLADELFAGSKELSIDALTAGVVARNPTLAQMIATWEAVQARYPQVTSLDDPSLQGGATPSIFGGEHLHGGWLATLSQKYYWPGKLRLRGENVQAQARAAANDAADVRLQLIESAKIAFYDYYLVARAIEVNDENLRLLRKFRESAVSRYEFGVGEKKAPQQDILQAEVEIGRQQKRDLTLKRIQLVAVARINTLLNRDPDVPLPPSPKSIEVADALPEAGQLRAAALRRRPDLLALSDRIQAEEAALALAYKEFCPDFDVIATYNTLWQPALQQPLVGVRMNLPVRLARRRAAVSEARARIAERRAELDRQVNQMNYEINQAYAEVSENKQAARLYQQTVVPKAEQNVESAQDAYTAAKIPFLTLVEAERDVIRLKDDYYQFVAEYYRRLATLERAAGGSLTLAEGDDRPPAGLTSSQGGGPCSACGP